MAESESIGWIINDQTNPYLTKEDRMQGWGYDARSGEHLGNYNERFSVDDFGRIAPLTVLTEEEMKIQEEQGCTACHD